MDERLRSLERSARRSNSAEELLRYAGAQLRANISCKETLERALLSAGEDEFEDVANSVITEFPEKSIASAALAYTQLRQGHVFVRAKHEYHLLTDINIEFDVHGYAGKLYDTSRYTAVQETLTSKIVATRPQKVQVLCNHEGKLYDAGAYNAVFETLTNTQVAARQNQVWALCSHEGKLYDGGDYNAVLETVTGTIVATRPDAVNALGSHDGKLYDATMGDSVFETVTDTIVTTRPMGTWALFNHEGKLYNAGYYGGVYETLTGVKLLPFCVKGIASIDVVVLARVLRKASKLSRRKLSRRRKGCTVEREHVCLLGV